MNCKCKGIHRNFCEQSQFCLLNYGWNHREQDLHPSFHFQNSFPETVHKPRTPSSQSSHKAQNWALSLEAGMPAMYLWLHTETWHSGALMSIAPITMATQMLHLSFCTIPPWIHCCSLWVSLFNTLSMPRFKRQIKKFRLSTYLRLKSYISLPTEFNKAYFSVNWHRTVHERISLATV